MRAAAVVTAALALAGCGAKTGLRVDARRDVPDAMDALDAMDVPAEPDVAEEPDVPQEPEAPPVCVPARGALTRSSAELVFVVDRSGSMGYALDGTPALGGTPSRWTILRNALAAALPSAERSLAMGAKFFPRVLDPSQSASAAETCALAPGLDLAPRLGAAASIVRVFDDTSPFGPTPTWAALDATLRDLRARPSRGVARAMVLATDGGPNCNFTPPPVCRCTSTSCPMTRPDWSSNCLDDTRSVAVLRDAARPDRPGVQAIPVFVVGIDEPVARGADFRDVLEAMALAGGRPRMEPGLPSYYSIRRPEDLRAALDTVLRAVNRCTFFTATRPADPSAVAVEIDGVEVPRDPTRADGWDWTNAADGELSFFGGTCMRASAEGVRAVARTGCRDD